jgi:Agrobacterium tumefaciens protein Atu4866
MAFGVAVIVGMLGIELALVAYAKELEAKEVQVMSEDQDRYVGMWVTKDGYVRHELLPGGRYDEARGKRKSAYRGSYRLTGDHIDYVDDTGFSADGEFRDQILYHAGMVLCRE